MGTQFLNADVGRCSTNLTNKLKSTMFRFVALFALVAVAFAEPEADSQFVYSNVAGVPVHGVYNTYAGHVVSPVVKAAVPAVPVVVHGPTPYRRHDQARSTRRYRLRQARQGATQICPTSRKGKQGTICCPIHHLRWIPICPSPSCYSLHRQA